MKRLIVGHLALAIIANAQIAPTVLLQGAVLDAQTRKPITARLAIYDANGARVNETRSNASEGGMYQCILRPGSRYTIELRSDGYMTTRDTVALPSVKSYTELSRDFTMFPKAIGQRFVLSVPIFEQDRPTFRIGADEELARYVQLLADNPDVYVTIECYPDRLAEPAKLAELARARATAIQQYFAQQGIHPSRLLIAPISSTDPYNPPPRKLRPKGRFYVGGTYFVVTKLE